MPENPVRHYPCPGCGAEMHYAPEHRGLHCDYCERTEAIACTQVPPKVPLGARSAAGVSGEATPIHCPKCGAGYALKAGVFAALCPYCETPALIDPRAPYSPEALLPFAVTRKQAQQIFARWIGSLWLAPNALKRLVDTQSEMKGYWLPWWLFDARTRSYYRGARGDAYYVTVERMRVVDGREQPVQEQERRIRWTPVSGEVARDFSDLPVPADTVVPPELLRGLPFPGGTSRCGSDERYCCGYEAREYSRPALEAYEEAKNLMQRQIRLDVLMDIGGDEQRIDEIQTRYADECCQYILRPLWSTAFRYKGREYRFVIDGTDGAIVGERPYSYWKIFFLAVLAVGLMLLVFYWSEISAYFHGIINGEGSGEVSLPSGLSPITP